MARARLVRDLGDGEGAPPRAVGVDRARMRCQLRQRVQQQHRCRLPSRGVKDYVFRV